MKSEQTQKDNTAKEILEQEIKQEEKQNWKGFIIEIVIWICIACICMFVVPRYVMQRTVVSGNSMQNTLFNNDNLIVEKVSRYFKDYDRFDIIIFFPEHLPVYNGDEYYVKRVIGLPGETIQIIGSDIYIDGEVLEENYGKDPIEMAGIAAEPIKLGKDEYFVLGDNRGASQDSRYREVGVVHKSSVEGKAILRIWPLNKFGLLE